MAKQTVEVLVSGGKATAAPPLGPAMGPLGVNIGQVVAEINKKTESFKGMQVPVKVTVDTDTKAFTIEIGTPPAAELIKKEAKVKSGAANPLTDKVADLKIEQVIKIAKMKEDVLLGKTMKEKVREIVGTCQSMGILVENVDAQAALKLIAEGKFDEKIKMEKTELTAEELRILEEERKHLEEELKERRTEFEIKAKEIIAGMKTKSRGAIKIKLVDEGIPGPLIDELLPEEDKKPAKGAPAKK